MWLKLSQFKVGLDFTETQLAGEVAQVLRLPADNIKNFDITHKSLDARQREPFFVYTLVFEVSLSSYEIEAIIAKNPNLSIFEPDFSKPISKHKINRPSRPVIVGAGPAGLFAGLKLAAAGLKPVIIDRGDSLTARIGAVNRFWNEKILDPESNIQYGIGGAGTFSDGKLMTRVKDRELPYILQLLIKLGGPPEIAYWQHPHIGTDLLRKVVTNLQDLIIDYGGEFHFRCCFNDLEKVGSDTYLIKTNTEKVWETDLLIPAIGNSARVVYELLFNKGFDLIVKPFAVGLRVEHPQDLIDRARYGKWQGHPKLGPAEYRLTFQHQETGRGVYSFCMCPGGKVIGATSEYNTVVTNGMSFQARDSGIANSALIVTVNQKDFNNESVLAGVDFQRALERKAFLLGGSNYSAPVQRVGDFLKKRPSANFTALIPTYKPGYTSANLWELLPDNICRAIKDGIEHFGRQVKGFDWPDAVLTGVETRTSAPVRILRNEQREANGFPGIYPVGEGAGYAGGIISSALDGWKTAEAIIDKYKIN